MCAGQGVGDKVRKVSDCKLAGVPGGIAGAFSWLSPWSLERNARDGEWHRAMCVSPQCSGLRGSQGAGGPPARK